METKERNYNGDYRYLRSTGSCTSILPLPMGSLLVPFCGAYLDFYKANLKKELPRRLWVKTEVQKLHQRAADEHCLLSGGQLTILPSARNAGC